MIASRLTFVVLNKMYSVVGLTSSRSIFQGTDASL